MALVQTSQSFQRDLDHLPSARDRDAVTAAVGKLRTRASWEGTLTPIEGYRPYVRAQFDGVRLICADLRRLDGRLLVVRALREERRGLRALVTGGICRDADFRRLVDMRA